MAGLDEGTYVEDLSREQLVEKLDRALKESADIETELELAKMRIDDLERLVVGVMNLREVCARYGSLDANALEYHDALAHCFDLAVRMGGGA